MASETTSNEESELEKLAQLADGEDRGFERAEEEQFQEAQESDYIDPQLARNTAKQFVNALSWFNKTAFDVPLDDEQKEDGVEKMAPIFEQGAIPPWLVDAIGRYGVWLGAGAFVAGVGYTTYETLKARASQDDDASPEQPKKQPNEEPIAAGSFTTMGEE
jgi:hypothetical protein